jgi:diamine N-acetyltransferase
MPDVTIRLATLADRPVIYAWMAHSDLTSLMMGPPLFPEHRIPSWQEFTKDYTEHYFRGVHSTDGHCCIIEVEGEAVGHVNYGEIDEAHRAVELDIWMRSRAFTRKGYGTQALGLLVDLLHRTFGCVQFYVGPSRRNPGAVAAYRKAGFEETEERPAWFVPDYDDVVLMRRVV